MRRGSSRGATQRTSSSATTSSRRSTTAARSGWSTARDSRTPAVQRPCSRPPAAERRREETGRARARPDPRRAHGRCGDYVRELELLDEAIDGADAVGDRRTQSYATLIRGHARLHVDPQFNVEDELAAVEEALRTFEELGDRRGEARA